MAKSSFIIALPTLNEEESLKDMVLEIKQLNYDFFMVDANSTDKTLTIAKELKVEVHQRDEIGKGYGCGIQKALRVAQQKGIEYLGIIDCDTTYPVSSFADMLKFIPEADLVIGIRPMASIEFWHRMANYLHSGYASLLFQRKVGDINSGMRIIRVEKFVNQLDARHMGMVAQMSSFAMRNDLHIKEVPITYGKRRGESKIRIWDSFAILWDITIERFKKRIAKA